MSPRELVTDGDRHFHAGDFEEAAAYFFTAARRRPSDPVARLALGHVLSPLGFYDEATDSITRGMALFAASRGSRGPTWGEMKVDLRGFYASRRRFALQLRQLETWVDENARDVKATFLLAYTYYFSGRRSDAKKLFRRALALDPDFDEALYFLRLLGALEMT